MNKKIALTIFLSIIMIGIVIFKNYSSIKRKDYTAKLVKFNTDILTINLPFNLITDSDTTYLENGDFFNTVRSVSGDIDDNYYTLSIANYNNEYTSTESFHIDSLKANLKNTLLADEKLRIYKLEQRNINQIHGIMYTGIKNNHTQKSIMFALDNNVISLNADEKDTLKSHFEEIIKSLAIKNIPKK